MQSPSMNTRVSKCLELATYSIRMFGKYATNVVLADLAAQMIAAKTSLGTAQENYEIAVRDILPARVDVKYENHISDRRIRLTQQKVEIADGKRGGRIANLVFPDGSTTITRLLGDSQIEAMLNLEGRIASATEVWADAKTEKADIEQHRKNYQIALEHRKTVGQTVRDKRALRNAAKEAFLTKYAEIQSRVGAEFPRDDVMQDLFFDEVRAKSDLAQADEDSNDTSEQETTSEAAKG